MSQKTEGPVRGWHARVASLNVTLSFAPLCFLSTAGIGAGIGWLRGERDFSALGLVTAAPGLAMLGLLLLGFLWPPLVGIEDERPATWATVPVVYTTLLLLVQGLVDSGGFALVRPLELGRTDHLWREPWAVATAFGLQVSLSLAMRRRRPA